MICSASSAVPVGTRAATGSYQTKRKIERDQPTKSYLLAGDEGSVGRIAELLASEGVRGGERAARERLRPFEVVRPPTVDEVLHARPDVAEEELLTWEAVLHPAIDAAGKATAAERQAILAKWAEWVEVLGGEVAVDYQRSIGGMTSCRCGLLPAPMKARSRVRAVAVPASMSSWPPSSRHGPAVGRFEDHGASRTELTAVQPFGS